MILYNVIIMFMVIITLILLTKPSYLFIDDEPKKFGCNYNETLIPLHIFSIFLALTLYIINYGCG
jgi:hypothetical protein